MSIENGSIVKSVQRGTISLAASATTGTVTITAVVTAKSIVNITGMHFAASWTQGGAILSMTNATTVTISLPYSTQPGCTVGYEVIEYV